MDNYGNRDFYDAGCNCTLTALQFFYGFAYCLLSADAFIPTAVLSMTCTRLLFREFSVLKFRMISISVEFLYSGW